MQGGEAFTCPCSSVFAQLKEQRPNAYFPAFGEVENGTKIINSEQSDSYIFLGLILMT
jgi:hypothetical protein